MDEVPADNVCHMYYLCVSENCSLIRRSSHSEVVGMHTLFITGSMELRDSQKACRDNTEMAWLPRISTYLLSVQWMVLHQGLHVPPKCLSLPGPAAVVMPHTDTTNLVILLPREQRVPQHMLILARTLICNSPKGKFQVCI